MLKILPKVNNQKVYKTRINPNGQEFYKKHPDLAPRNVYLYMGRILDLKTVKKYINNIGKESIFEKIENWFSNLFNKK